MHLYFHLSNAFWNAIHKLKKERKPFILSDNLHATPILRFFIADHHALWVMLGIKGSSSPFRWTLGHMAAEDYVKNMFKPTEYFLPLKSIIEKRKKYNEKMKEIANLEKGNKKDLAKEAEKEVGGMTGGLTVFELEGEIDKTQPTPHPHFDIFPT